METDHSDIPKLLFVDDESGVLNAMQRIFHDEPCEVLTASGGQTALELLQETGPVPLIISDYLMPGMTGVEFLQKVMQLWPDTRRVILSAYTDSNVLLSAVNEGRIHRFLVKPWNNDALKSVVHEMLEEYRIIDEFRHKADEVAHNNRLLSRTNEHLSAILADVLKNMRQISGGDDSQVSALPLKKKHHNALSQRELQIMLAIASGQSLKAIAMDLKLSIKTISTYKKRLCEKMNFNNDAELIGYTLKNNLLPATHL